MTKRPPPFLLGITAVSILVSPGAFLDGFNGAALAAEPQSSRLNQAGAPLAVPLADGWYTFGTPAVVIEREEIVPDGVTLLTLSNGVRLVLKPTDLVADEVLVNVAVDGGIQSLAPEPGIRAAAEIAETMFLSGGVGLKTHEQLLATLPAVSSLEFSVWSPRFNLGGKAQSAELRPLLEILTAYVSDPGWRFDGLEAVKAAEIENRNLTRSNANSALQTQAPGLLTSGDPRLVRPTEAQISAVDADDARRAIENQLQSGAIEIGIVGDFDPEAVIAMVAGTFGTLPARPGVPAPQGAPRFPLPTSTPIPLYFSGRPEDQGRIVAWPVSPRLFRPQEEQAITAMLGILIYRLMDLPAYEATGFNRSFNARNGYLFISAVGRSETLADFESDIARIARDMVVHGVTQEEIDRAQSGAAEDTKFVQSNSGNVYWSIVTMDLRGDRRNWEKARSSLSYIEGVTPEEVHNVATRYLVEDRSVAIIALPDSAPQSR